MKLDNEAEIAGQWEEILILKKTLDDFQVRQGAMTEQGDAILRLQVMTTGQEETILSLTSELQDLESLTSKWKARKLNKVKDILATNKIDYEKKCEWKLQEKTRKYAAYYKDKGEALCRSFREKNQCDSCKCAVTDNGTFANIDWRDVLSGIRFVDSGGDECYSEAKDIEYKCEKECTSECST